MRSTEREQRWSDEAGPAPTRGQIAKSLHDGILQDLTVAGFRLRALEQAAPDAAPGLRDFGTWLAERQGHLRQFVTSLHEQDAVSMPVERLVATLYLQLAALTAATEISFSRGRTGALVVSHNGRPLREHPDALAALGESFNHDGIDVAVSTVAGREQLIVAWAAK